MCLASETTRRSRRRAGHSRPTTRPSRPTDIIEPQELERLLDSPVPVDTAQESSWSLKSSIHIPDAEVSLQASIASRTSPSGSLTKSPGSQPSNETVTESFMAQARSFVMEATSSNDTATRAEARALLTTLREIDGLALLKGDEGDGTGGLSTHHEGG
ncbi:hypothetical protein BD289DRAFT_25312 [Coniella lustricola]|uniref:Uncharacterized protein n=1 Tax=Coniella lustricola TaxID=2025994 RepID=A0A2T3A391_9PEZI|nr:hypothetical protein BD289DRAFT_25312 [Coniella lustricola]